MNTFQKIEVGMDKGRGKVPVYFSTSSIYSNTKCRSVWSWEKWLDMVGFDSERKVVQKGMAEMGTPESRTP